MTEEAILEVVSLENQGLAAHEITDILGISPSRAYKASQDFLRNDRVSFRCTTCGATVTASKCIACLLQQPYVERRVLVRKHKNSDEYVTKVVKLRWY